MKIHRLIWIQFSLWVVGCMWCGLLFADSLDDRLKELSSVIEVDCLESDDHLIKRVCMVEQKLDWQNKNAENFQQRVIIKHRGFDKPTVMVTEGYDAMYALKPNFKEELSTLLDANLIFVEHRYFGRSMPSPCNWDYLTVENSVGDYHHIRKEFGGIYKGKWFTTGISKGGQTTLFYRAYYPNDVDGSVAYVAPLNKSLEDGRHEMFLHRIDNQKIRKKILEFQREVLRRRNTILPMVRDFCKRKGLQFRTTADELYDLMVLEMEFAFWQWGYSAKSLPLKTASDSILCKYLLRISPPDYFSPMKGNTSFNVQAMRELGYYGYDIQPLKDLLSIQRTEGYMRRVMIPDSLVYIEFDTNLYEKVNRFLKVEDCPMIFIYGENDPWSASGVTWLNNKEKMHVFVEPKGSHKARIATMPKTIQKRIMKILHAWLQ